MTPVPLTESGSLLWRLLPLIYRRWDGTHGKDPKHPLETPKQRGDLAEFLDAHGVLFDRIRGTLDQRLLDTSPNTCQPWLIPYFADLLDVRLVSPDIAGQREEVARAVSWRQRKGTIGCTSEIAQEVGRLERIVAAPDDDSDRNGHSDAFPTLHVQEGFRRVVTTARIGVPLPSPRSLGLSGSFAPSDNPIEAARLPGLPPGTVDFRFLSRAREIKEPTPVSRIGAFDTSGVRWQQEYPTGVPCYRDTYQDSSARTVDIRTPGWAHGHYHPRRVLVYSAPPDGFFPPGQFDVTWGDLVGWFASFDTTDPPWLADREDEEGNRIRERALPLAPWHGGEIALIERETTQRDGRTRHQRIVGLRRSAGDPQRDDRIERIGASENAVVVYVLITGFELIEVDHGARLTLRGFGEKPPRISPGQGVELDALGPATAYDLEGFVVAGQLNVHDAKFTMRRVAVEHLTAHVTAAPKLPDGSENPALSIMDSLIRTLEVTGDGLCRLEYCTTLAPLHCESLEASDCILLGVVDPDFSALYLRYCCAPWAPSEQPDRDKGRLHEPTISRTVPLFLSSEFGEAGCGVLHPGAASAIRAGAEDGGELGAYHHRHFVLREEAVIDKLRDFLPVSHEPVLIPQGSWKRPVPRAKNGGQ